jgi:hypothetical protein
MIQAYLNSVKPQETPKTVETPKPAKIQAKKAEPKPTPTPPVEKPSESQLDPVKEISEEVSLAYLTSLARKKVDVTDRETVKALIASFGKGALSTVPQEKYKELKTALEAL